ncbi:MAG: invasion associated locus B family protein [Sedimenticola sp.]|nr:invasion associated locus B family protein [Sedimenticola sp.]
MRGCRWFGAALLLVVLPWSAVQAQEQPAAEDEESAKVEVFGDWGKRCQVLQASGNELCLIFQRLRLKENNQTVLYVTFGYPPIGQGPVMVLTTPLGVSLTAGVQLQVDGKGENQQVAYNVCVQDGCRASLVVGDALLEAMLAGEKLNVTFANAQNKSLGLEVSLNGFSEASGTLNQ